MMEPMYDTAELKVEIPLNLLISLVERATRAEMSEEKEHDKYLDAYYRASQLQQKLDEIQAGCACKCEETE